MNINMNFNLIRIDKELDFLKENRILLENMILQGTISSTDAEIEQQEIMTKEQRLKEKYVLERHVKADGTPKKIIYHEGAIANFPNGYYYTRVNDTYKPKRATLTDLYDILYKYYKSLDNDDKESKLIISNIWEAAFDEFKTVKTSTLKTITVVESYYRRYIDDDFASKDITKITLLDLQKYTKKLVDVPVDKRLSINNYNEYKQVLNIIYRYARSHGLVTEDLPGLIDNQEYKKLCRPKKKKAEEKILSIEEIDLLKNVAIKKCNCEKYNVYGYMIRLSIETGMRVAELCSLKWEDINDEFIHIHTQQREIREKGKPIYYEEINWTKNEKGISQDGRNFPMTNSISEIFSELKSAQEKFGLKSEYVFCRCDNKWVPKRCYEKVLADTCRKLKLNKTNNHALRMSLNSNIFIAKGMPVTMRAKLLGHSVETNLNFYSFESKDYIYESKMLLEA